MPNWSLRPPRRRAARLSSRLPLPRRSQRDRAGWTPIRRVRSLNASANTSSAWLRWAGGGPRRSASGAVRISARSAKELTGTRGGTSLGCEADPALSELGGADTGEPILLVSKIKGLNGHPIRLHAKLDMRTLIGTAHVEVLPGRFVPAPR